MDIYNPHVHITSIFYHNLGVSCQIIPFEDLLSYVKFWMNPYKYYEILQYGQMDIP